jgi:hypothetical protein
MTKHDYPGPGSFERVEEAALAYADADTENDVDFHRRKARLRAAVLAFLWRVQRPTRVRDERPEQPGLPFRKMG